MTALVSNAVENVARADARAGKYLTFQLGSEEFAIRVLQVREIMGLQDITTVPNTPSYIKGVINLRGKVIPVLCLRAKFGMPAAASTSLSCIIVVQLENQDTSAPGLLMGVVVDAVSEVLNISPGDIEDTPDFGSGRATPYLLGMAKLKGKVKILLDIDQAVKSGELSALSELVHEQDV